MPPTIEIDRTGDLTLTLTLSKNLDSTPENNTRNLLTSSKILTLASPVFAAMLSPRFREGQRSENGTLLAPIPLPDDDADAMTLLCQILHFRYDALPTLRPSLALFRDLAVLCDKYDCVAPLRFVSEAWLGEWEACARSQDLEVLLFVSFVFGRAQRFAGLSGRLVREFCGNLEEDLKTLGGFDAVPEELLRGLQQQRKLKLKSIEAAIATQEEIMTVVSDKSFVLASDMRSCISCLQFVQPKVHLCPRCRITTAPAMCSRLSRRGEYAGYLKDVGLNPFGLWFLMETKSINEIAESIAKAQIASEHHNCGGTTNCLLKNAFTLLNKDITTLVDSTKGLCLDCLNAEIDNVGLKPDCSFGHGRNGVVEAVETVHLNEDAE